MKPSRRTAVAEPLKVAPVQRGVKDTGILNHLVMHVGRLSTCRRVREALHLAPESVSGRHSAGNGDRSSRPGRRQRQGLTVR